MAAPVDNYPRFESVLGRTKDRCDLFGIVLFDDRAKHKAIKQFCISNFQWLDNLASINKMILFLPIEERKVVGGFRLLNKGRSEYKNCSLQVANDFNIPPNHLPAFLFFTLKQGELCVQHSATLQFESAAFAGKADEAQDFVSDVFSAVSSARRSKEPNELIIKLQSEINRIKREQRLTPIKNWAKDYIIGLANVPLDISRVLARAGIKKLVGTT
jgi:hypothetical protein